MFKMKIEEPKFSNFLVIALPLNSPLLLFLPSHVRGTNYLLKAESKTTGDVEDFTIAIDEDVLTVEDALKKHTKQEVI